MKDNEYTADEVNDEYESLARRDCEFEDDEGFDPDDHGSLTVGERNPSLADRRYF